MSAFKKKKIRWILPPPQTQVVYGAHCSWWGYAEEAARKGTNVRHKLVACCPHCRGNLLQLPAARWKEQIAEASKHAEYAGYEDFIIWVKGKCYSTVELARAAWHKARGGLQ